jgi:Polyketide cyclase / dehydrase and lipid transport
MRHTLAAVGPADPDDVWERYAEPAAWPSWSPQIRRVEFDGARIRAGATGAAHGPCGVAVDFEIIAVDEPAHEWSWRVAAPFGVRLFLVHGVSPHAGGTRTTLDIDGAAPFVLGYAPLAQLALNRLVRMRQMR